MIPAQRKVTTFDGPTINNPLFHFAYHTFLLGEGQSRLDKYKIYLKQIIQLELHDNKLDYEMKNY